MKKTKTIAEKFFLKKEHCEFIEEFEEKWLQFATAEERVKAFFGDIANAKKIYQEWKKGNNLFEKERHQSFSRKPLA